MALAPIPAPRGITKRIEDKEAVSFLLDLARLKYLLPFLGRERTVNEVAPEVGLSPNSLLYRVRKMCALGLLEVSRLEPRRGRPVKVYRSTADSFFIPFSATDAETPADLFFAWEAPWGRLLVESMVRAVLGPVVRPDAPWGLQIYREGNHLEAYTRVIPVPEQDRPLNLSDPANLVALGGHLTGLRLDDGDARAFQQGLILLVQRYARLRGRTPYLVRLGVAPLPEESNLPPMSVL